MESNEQYFKEDEEKYLKINSQYVYFETQEDEVELPEESEE